MGTSLRLKRYFCAIVATLIIGQLSAASVRALPDYLKTYAGDRYARAELRTKCSVCHLNPAGGGERNAFGRAFQANGMTISPEMRRQFPDLFVSDRQPLVTFTEGSDSEATIEIDGRRYVINTRAKTVTETKPALPASPIATTTTTAKPEAARRTDIHRTADVRLVNLPTAMPIARGSLWTDFTHRFPFGKPTNAEGLFGLDAQAIPSFGFVYGLTDRLQVGVYRSPGDLGRALMIYGGASILSEESGDPISVMARVGFEGRDNFRRSFTTSFEATIARSLTRHASLYFVPTISIGDRPFSLDPKTDQPGVTAVALGIGGSLNIRPSVALMAEANYRVNETARYLDLGRGIHRPVIGLGIRKTSASQRHSFSLTLSNGPGTTFSQRSQTRGLYFADDGLRGLTIGFNLSRRLF